MAHGRALTAEERAMVVRAHAYFTREKQAGRPRHGRARAARARRARPQRACPLLSIANVLKQLTHRRQCARQEGKPRAKRGRPMTVEDAQVEPLIRNFIAECTASQRPISAESVRDELARAGVARISSRSTRRVLMRLGYQYIHRERRYELATQGDGDANAGCADSDIVNV